VSLSVKKKEVFSDKFKMPTYYGVVELRFWTQNLTFKASLNLLGNTQQ